MRDSLSWLRACGPQNEVRAGMTTIRVTPRAEEGSLLTICGRIRSPQAAAALRDISPPGEAE